jgi:hypothetical protein
MSTTIRMADGDLYINSAGRAETITGADKAAQDLAEVFMTPLDGLRDYGSELASLDIPPQISVFAGKALLSKKVDEAVQRLKRKQEADSYVTDDELIESINRLVIDQFGPGDFVFWVSVLLRDQTVSNDQVLAVSLRHQESYSTTTESLRELSRRG